MWSIFLFLFTYLRRMIKKYSQQIFVWCFLDLGHRSIEKCWHYTEVHQLETDVFIFLPSPSIWVSPPAVFFMRCYHKGSAAKLLLNSFSTEKSFTQVVWQENTVVEYITMTGFPVYQRSCCRGSTCTSSSHPQCNCRENRTNTIKGDVGPVQVTYSRL